MAKLINYNNFSQGFGESFNQTISDLRRLREQREQFDQELGFKERQLGLENKRIEQTGRYYDNLDLSRKFDIYQNLYPSQEGQQGAMTGGEIEKQFGADIYSPEQEKGYFSPYKPETPSMPDNLWEDVTTGATGTGDYLGKKVNILRNKLTNEERQVPVYQEPKEPKPPIDDDKLKPYKEGELTEAGAKSLAFFTNPTDLGSGFLGIGGTSKEEASQMLDHNFTVFAKDVLSSDSYRYVKNYLDTEGYLEPEVLKLNAINDAKMGKLTETQINEIATFLNYYDTAYEGIKKIEGYTK